jgi:hypothetical protein
MAVMMPAIMMAAPAVPVHAHVMAIAMHVVMVAVHMLIALVALIVVVALIMAVLRGGRGGGEQAESKSRREGGRDFHVSSPIRLVLT